MVLVKKARRIGSDLLYGAGFDESPGIRRNVVNNATLNRDCVHGSILREVILGNVVL